MSLLDRITARLQRRWARRELERFDAAQLHDLGITRADIDDYLAGRLAQPTPPRPAPRLVWDATTTAEDQPAECCKAA